MKKNQKLLDQYVNEILAKYNLPAIAACVVNKHGKEDTCFSLKPLQ